MTSPAPSIFDSFNARALKPQQVAKTFVPSLHFTQLLQRRHTIIVGPRGSGKTTLLKMLTQPALEAWDHPEADEARDRVDFTGIFVATDKSWGEQIGALGEGRLDAVSHQLLGKAAFTTHTLKALSKALIERSTSRVDPVLTPFRRVKLEVSAEAEIVRTLAQAWHLEPAIGALISVKQALTRRLLEIQEIANREIFLGEAGRSSRLGAVEFLHLDFLEAAGVAIELFDDLTGEGDGRWAFLFDELELAPQWVTNDLLHSLRGKEERLLFKLALSPSSPDLQLMDNSLSAFPDNDFDQIALWYAEKVDGYKFCERLWLAMLEEKGIEPKKPEAALGISVFDTSADEWKESGTAYGPGSRLADRFARMMKLDASFGRYLSEREIDPLHLDLLSSDRRAAEVRKVAPLIALREFYRFPDYPSERRRKTRSRKLPTIYAGADSLFAISEGNPRWFIGMMGRVLDQVNIHQRKIPPNVQAAEIQKTGERFKAMLKTIPVALSNGIAPRGILSIVSEIGEFFHAQAVTVDFVAEPIGTFIVDSNTSEELLSAIGQALNAGALVYVPDDRSQLLLSSARGKRFRLSYLLAPLFGMPLRLGPPLSLRKILERGGKPLSVATLSLFGEKLHDE